MSQLSGDAGSRVGSDYRAVPPQRVQDQSLECKGGICDAKQKNRSVVLVVILGIAVSAAQAGEKCSLQTMTGTYAFYERGSSMVLDLDPAHQTIPVHWNGAIAPFVTVGEVTFTPDGVGEGFYWILTGSLSGGADPIPVQVTIFEMNPDCTGKFRYWITLPNAPQPTLVEERFFAFDNGSEYRSVPSLIGATGTRH